MSSSVAPAFSGVCSLVAVDLFGSLRFPQADDLAKKERLKRRGVRVLWIV